MDYSSNKEAGREYAALLSRKLNLEISFVEAHKSGMTLQVTRWQTYGVIDINGNVTKSIIRDEWMACSRKIYSTADISFCDMGNGLAEYMLKKGYTRISKVAFDEARGR